MGWLFGEGSRERKESDMDRRVLFLAALCFGLTAGAGLFADGTAESDDFGIRLVPPQAKTCPAVGGEATVRVLLDFNLEGDAVGAESPWLVQGWSLGVCHDPAVLEVAATASGADTKVVKAGAPPQFERINLATIRGGVDNAPTVVGVTHGVVIDFDTIVALVPRNDFEDMVITYSSLAATAGTAVTSCDDLGKPKVVSVMVVSGKSIGPSARGGAMIEVKEVCPCCPRELAFTGPADPVDLVVQGSVGTGDVDAGIGLADRKQEPSCQEPEGTNCPLPVLSPVQGFSVSMSSPAEGDVEVTDIRPGAGIAGLNEGAGPDFFATGIRTACFYAGVVFSTSEPFDTILADVEKEIIALTIATAMCVRDPVTRTFTFEDGCGNPGIDNVVVVGGARKLPVLDGKIVVEVSCKYGNFVRGDANVDALVNIADGVWILNELFRGGPATTCDDAADTNDDGERNAADAVYILNYIFLSGPTPPAPAGACGEDPTEDALECDEYRFCQ